jgi:hypothetical protein
MMSTDKMPALSLSLCFNGQLYRRADALIADAALSVRPETFFAFSRRYCGRLVRCTRFSMSPHRLRGRACQPSHINAMKKQTKFPDGH